MFKRIMIIGCMLAVAGCATNNAELNPASTNIETPKTGVPRAEAPKIEPARVDIPVPQKPTISVEQPKAQIPTSLNFKRNVTFNHKFHSDSFACTKCHKDSPGKIVNFGKEFAHETCKGCHKENGQSIACNSCHRG